MLFLFIYRFLSPTLILKFSCSLIYRNEIPLNKHYGFGLYVFHLLMLSSCSVLIHSSSSSRRRCLQSVCLSEGVHSLT